MNGDARGQALLRLGALACDWPAPARVRAFVTTRRHGLSEGAFGSVEGTGRVDDADRVNDAGRVDGGLNLGARCGDEPQRVAANRARLVEALGAPVHWLNQVHGSQVQLIAGGPAAVRNDPACAADVSAAAPGEPIAAADEPIAVADEPVADAAVTTSEGIVLAVLTADCLPVFLCAANGQAVGISHAGWRGLAAGVIEQTVSRMRDACGVSGGEIAHFGPAIGPGFFEVGAEVRAAFCDADAACAAAFVALPTPGKYLADLYALARHRLQRLGITNFSGGRYCTVRDQQLFYSHRRDRVSGRMASLIWLER